MRWLAKLKAMCRSFFQRQRAEADLETEIRDHFEREIENGIQAGLRPEEARLAAQRLFGSVTLFKEECRDARGTAFAEIMSRDLRYGFRSLRRTPVFTVVAVATLALGIGANTTLFTFVENILLRSLPVRDPASLAAPVWGNTINISYLNYVDFRNRNTTLSSLVAYRYNAASLSLEARDNLRVWGYQVTGNYFPTLGIAPALGRFFSPDDDQQGGRAVVVISHRLWQNRFAADPNVVGRAVKMNGFPLTVIGVAPERFGGTELIVAADYWVPLSLQPQLEPGFNFMQWRTSQNLSMLGRLKPGVSAAQVEGNLDQIAQELARSYPNDVSVKDRFHLTRPGLSGSDLRGPVTKFSTVLMAVAGVGLLLACANLAGMLLARASDRQREVGIRLALGASKLQLMRQFFAESLLLAAGGGLLGLAIAYLACDRFSAWHPVFAIPISTAIHPTATVLWFTLAVALTTTLLFGLTPALEAVRTDVVSKLKNEPVSSHLRKWTLRELLVPCQIALSVILVVSSVLVLRSLQHALALNLGFQPVGALSVSFDLGLQRYTPERSRRFDTDVLSKVRNIPGIDPNAVGIANALPLRAGGLDSEFIARTDQPVPARSDSRLTMVYNISPGYFRAVGTRLLSGRDINDHDRQGSPPSAVVNEAAARLLFGKNGPLGKRFRLTMNPADPGIEIVGVVETGKYLSLREDPEAAVFLPMAQSGTTWTTIVARSHLPAQVAAESIRKAVLDLDPELTVFDMGSLTDQLAMPLLPSRIAAIVLGAFGTLAIILAATGLFALMSYAVARRTREIGIRLALGAQPGQVIFPVLQRALLLCGAGIALGTIIALAAGQVLSSVLYGVSSRDPVSYGIALMLMLAVALFACWNPVARVIRIDPAKTLRAD